MAVTDEQQNDVLALILFYDRYGWDWSLAAEFLIRKYNGSWVRPAPE